MKLREIPLLRLAAQGLLDTGDATPAEVVRRMACMQGQDYPGVLASIALRSAAGTRAAVEAALDAGEIVRSWPMRGTLHAVPAEDLGWMMELTAEKVLRSAGRRREVIGLEERDVTRAAEVARAALAGGKRMVRKELMEVWTAAGLPVDQQRGYHTLWWAAQTGVIVFGPVRGSEQQLVLLDEWVPSPRRLEGEEACGEWALRYFRSHGPATLKDFAWWTKLTMKEARAGHELAAGALESVSVEGADYLMDPATPDVLEGLRSRARGVFLLPGFDEFMLGYQDRGAALPAEHAQRLVPGNNGVFRSSVVAAGQVVGTWRHKGKGDKRALEVEPFDTLSATVERAATQRHKSLP